MQVKKDVLLKSYTTFKIGGPARYFFTAKNKEGLIEAIKFAREKKLPFFIFGGGSNVLVSDEGFKGLVIKMKNEKCKMKNENSKCKIFCEAGVELDDLVKSAAENNLTGLEWAAGIPGTIGGAVHNNAAAFENSMKDIVKSVEVFDVSKNTGVLDPSAGRTRVGPLQIKDCRFDYKESVFKKNKNLIILSCLLELKKGNSQEIENKINYCLKYREKNHPLNLSSAGSIFKNPSKMSAGELIEKCGLKGKRIGEVEVSTKHANFIVNLGGGKAKDVLRLINLIKKKVKEKFRIELEEEIQFLGF